MASSTQPTGSAPTSLSLRRIIYSSVTPPSSAVLYHFTNAFISFWFTGAKQDQPFLSGHLSSSFLRASCCYGVVPFFFFFFFFFKTLGKASMWKEGTAFSCWVPALDMKLWPSSPAVLEWNYSEFLQYSIRSDAHELLRDSVPYWIYSVYQVHMCYTVLNEQQEHCSSDKQTHR